MKIEKLNNNSQTFGKLYIYSSQMNKVQKTLSDKVADSVSISTLYKMADDRNVDVYILPHTKNPNAINIRYMDGWSDNYFKNNGRFFQTSGEKDELIRTIAARVKKQLSKILTGEIKYPLGNVNDVKTKDTDLQSLRPELF